MDKERQRKNTEDLEHDNLKEIKENNIDFKLEKKSVSYSIDH